MELFTYTANSQHFFSLESLGFDRESSSDIKALFDYYLKALDLYVRWHFLPAEYENKDFPPHKRERGYSSRRKKTLACGLRNRFLIKEKYD